MANETPSQARETAKQTGALLLALGGVAAAFGAASCCALPLLLGSLGLGSAWLVAVAWIAAPHRVALLTAALVCLIGGGVILAWHRRTVATCAPGTICGNRAVAAVSGRGFGSRRRARRSRLSVCLRSYLNRF